MMQYKKLLGLFTAVLISVILFIFRDKFEYFSELGYFGLFILGVLNNATLIIPLPILPPAIYIAASTLNPILVTIIASLGSAIGELTGYFAGTSGGYLIKNESSFIKIKKWMDKYGLWTVFFLSAVPNFVFDVAGIVSGISKIPVHRFLLVTFVGKIFRYFIIAFLGYKSFDF